MTHEHAIWLKEHFEKKCYRATLKGSTVGCYYEAERILRGKDKINKRGCTCQHKDMGKLVNSMFDQYSAQINKLYEEAKNGIG